MKKGKNNLVYFYSFLILYKFTIATLEQYKLSYTLRKS